MEFDGDIVKFNIFDAMKFPCDVSYAYSLDSQDAFDFSNFDVPKTAICKNLTFQALQEEF
ncbi:hypothetical protein EPI10_006776 [Gossypium australe]|uniref:Uncharacterized protein n=1 Tax=Gossypium australe TaxID=47621 RepID=A0A5B6WV98_9ROSI|nr:hypothetical protein EPI10_006776 [Gossypium australe]